MTNIGKTLKIAGVSERDTDLLLLEEFISSEEFCRFFLAALELGVRAYEFVEAVRSVTDSTGESDLEVHFKKGDGSRLVLMLENKVNAGFQPRQAERYRERGQNYINHGKVDDFITVLLAPIAYFSGDQKGFDHRINYETIRAWFEQSDIRSGRKQYKISMLTSAIEKSTHGYQLVADAAVSDFWMAYWRLSLEIAPELNMEEPSNKPAGSSFVYFRQVGLPEGVNLVHKLGHGYFDLQFSGMGDCMAELRARLGDKMTDNMKIVKAAKSASIRLTVPKVSVADALEDQHKAVVTAIEAGKSLLQWARTSLN